MLNDKLITMYNMLVGTLGQRAEWRHHNYVFGIFVYRPT